MPLSAEYMDMPFDEAIEFLRQKLNLPTETWKDIWKGAHSRAFVVAGAIKKELIEDLRGAVKKPLLEGTTLNEFRKDFDNIVQKHGWTYKGGTAWRTAVMFNTNLSVAYSAGHWKQMTDPDVLKVRPFLRYVGSSSAEPRTEHMAWYNTVLPADDPWWDTHYPPNGWGCKCGVVSHSAREVEKITKEEAKGDHPVKTEAPKAKEYEWVDKATGEVHKVPKGIDPGWDYNPGKEGFRDN